LRSHIRRLGVVFATALTLTTAAATVQAYSPSVAELDATARAAGNRRDLAQHIGDAIFSAHWPAEVSQISATELDGHLIVGIRVLGVKFHRPLTRDEFVGEVVALVERAFAAVPAAEEIDLWASVPVSVAKGVVVSGDLAMPTSRTVFSLSARRGESPAALRDRARRMSDGVFWDAGWVETAFKGGDV
jgi:hypothetical protein